MNRLPLFISSFLLIAVCCIGCQPEVTEVTEAYVHCRSLDGDRTAEKIFEWEFVAVSDVIRRVCPPEKAMTIDKIEQQAVKTMAPELKDTLPQPRQSVHRVLLELEVRGEFVRLPQESESAPRTLKRITLPAPATDQSTAL